MIAKKDGGKILDAVITMIAKAAGNEEVTFDKLYPVTNHCVVIKIGAEKYKIKLEKCNEMVMDEEENPNYNPEGFHHETGRLEE